MCSVIASIVLRDSMGSSDASYLFFLFKRKIVSHTTILIGFRYTRSLYETVVHSVIFFFFLPV